MIQLATHYQIYSSLPLLLLLFSHQISRVGKISHQQGVTIGPSWYLMPLARRQKQRVALEAKQALKPIDHPWSYLQIYPSSSSIFSHQHGVAISSPSLLPLITLLGVTLILILSFSSTSQNVFKPLDFNVILSSFFYSFILNFGFYFNS